MRIFLPHLAKIQGSQQADFKIEERLPEQVSSACVLHCDYQATRVDSTYFILSIKVATDVEITCYRCLKSFIHPYQHTFELAVCDDEKLAESLMSHYECITSDTYWINMIDILTDDLHLNCPAKHLEIAQCDQDVKRLITNA